MGRVEVRGKAAPPFLFLHGSSWVEIPLSAEEEDANAVVAEAAKAPGRGLEALDFRVQPLGHRGGKMLRQIRPQVVQMTLADLGPFAHRLAAAPAPPAQPLFEEPAGPTPTSGYSPNLLNRSLAAQARAPFKGKSFTAPHSAAGFGLKCAGGYSPNGRGPLRVGSPCALNSLCAWRRTGPTAAPRYWLT